MSSAVVEALLVLVGVISCLANTDGSPFSCQEKCNTVPFLLLVFFFESLVVIVQMTVDLNPVPDPAES